MPRAAVRAIALPRRRCALPAARWGGKRLVRPSALVLSLLAACVVGLPAVPLRSARGAAVVQPRVGRGSAHASRAMALPRRTLATLSPGTPRERRKASVVDSGPQVLMQSQRAYRALRSYVGT